MEYEQQSTTTESAKTTSPTKTTTVESMSTTTIPSSTSHHSLSNNGQATPVDANANANANANQTKQQQQGQDDDDDGDALLAPAAVGPVVDMEVFGQLLEIDDDESHEFSKTLAFDYIGQAETTFEEIEAALDAQDLEALSRKGHFLKGSSAALGLQRVQHSCELMQHYGKCKDGNGEGPDLNKADSLKRCRSLLKRLRGEQDEAKSWLEGFYKS